MIIFAALWFTEMSDCVTKIYYMGVKGLLKPDLLVFFILLAV